MRDYTIFTEISNEMTRQESIWGIQHHTSEYWLTIVMEEIGEAAMAMLAKDHNANPKTTRKHEDNLRQELVQTTACLLHWIEDIDQIVRNNAI